jgi:hypothetical protein
MKGLTEISLHSPFFSVTSDESEASGNKGGVPCADSSSSTDPSPSSLSAGLAEGGDADPSRPYSGSFVTRSVELDPFARWPTASLSTPDMI